MKYLSNWHRLENEDEHTALVFGFLRHAPTEYALNLWLTAVLVRDVQAQPLQQAAFWPTLPSVFPTSVTTQPELMFDADDGEPLTVVVEVKPGYGQQMLAQITREVVDVANARGASRIACVMVGADLGPPMDLRDWEASVTAALREHLPSAEVDVEIAYSSFASFGQAAQECARIAPEWSAYVEDVVAKLRRNALMGYDGTPMTDDLEELTIPNAVEAFNRAIQAARLFFLQLHAQPKFKEIGIQSWNETGHRMFRNGNSMTITQPPKWFDTTVAMCLYKRANWDPQSFVTVFFDLRGTDGHADLVVGAGLSRGANNASYGFPEASKDAGLSVAALRDCHDPSLPRTAAEPGSEWRFDRRPWKPGQGDEDITWALDRLEHAISVWDAETQRVRGVTGSGFDGISTETVRNWLAYWEGVAAGRRKGEEGRDPVEAAAQARKELEAREERVD